MAKTADVHRCVAQRWLSHALERAVVISDAADGRSLAEMLQVATAKDFNLRQLIAAGVSSEAFLAP